MIAMGGSMDHNMVLSSDEIINCRLYFSRIRHLLLCSIAVILRCKIVSRKMRITNTVTRWCTLHPIVQKFLAFLFSQGARGRVGSFGVVLGSFFRPLVVAQYRVGIQNSLWFSVILCDSLLGRFEHVVRDAGDFPLLVLPTVCTNVTLLTVSANAYVFGTSADRWRINRSLLGKYFLSSLKWLVQHDCSAIKVGFALTTKKRGNSDELPICYQSLLYHSFFSRK